MDEPLSAGRRHRSSWPDIAFIFGFIWAGLMFFSARLEPDRGPQLQRVTWAAFMSIYGILSKVALFLIGFVAMRAIGMRRRAKMIVATQS